MRISDWSSDVCSSDLADAGDDKMEAAARAQAKSIWDIAAHYTDAFKRNIADLNIIPPSEWTVATDYVPQMIAFAEKIAPAHCYELERDRKSTRLNSSH